MSQKVVCSYKRQTNGAKKRSTKKKERVKMIKIKPNKRHTVRVTRRQRKYMQYTIAIRQNIENRMGASVYYMMCTMG